MPAMYDCHKCGNRYWNLRPHVPEDHALAIFGCVVSLVDGKYCPHCGAEDPNAPHPDVYKESLRPDWVVGEGAD